MPLQDGCAGVLTFGVGGCPFAGMGRQMIASLSQDGKR
jgi:hypothetical protein